MLMLLFYIENERYAIDSRQVVEVVPLVELKKLHQSPEYVSGLLNYRHQIIPVIDLSQLINGHLSRPYLSTRIILVNYLGKDETLHILGLLAERVTQTLAPSATQVVDSEIAVNTASYLGKLVVNEQEMIQCLQVQPLITQIQQTCHLLPG